MAVTSLVVGLATSLAGAAMKEGQASLERDEAEIAAKQEELAVKQREADRKDRLAGALATQNAMAGARGVAAFEGSPLTVLQDSIEREQLATERDTFSTRMQTMGMRQVARTRQRHQRYASAASLFQSAYPIAQTGGFGG